jgi:hypothetical protein
MTAGVAVVGGRLPVRTVSEVRTRPTCGGRSLIPPRGGAACAASIIEGIRLLALLATTNHGSLVDAFASGASGCLPMAASLGELLDATASSTEEGSSYLPDSSAN